MDRIGSVGKELHNFLANCAPIRHALPLWTCLTCAGDGVGWHECSLLQSRKGRRISRRAERQWVAVSGDDSGSPSGTGDGPLGNSSPR